MRIGYRPLNMMIRFLPAASTTRCSVGTSSDVSHDLGVDSRQRVVEQNNVSVAQVLSNVIWSRNGPMMEELASVDRESLKTHPGVAQLRADAKLSLTGGIAPPSGHGGVSRR